MKILKRLLVLLLLVVIIGGGSYLYFTGNRIVIISNIDEYIGNTYTSTDGLISVSITDKETAKYTTAENTQILTLNSTEQGILHYTGEDITCRFVILKGGLLFDISNRRILYLTV